MTVIDEAKKALDGVTPGRAVQFHPSYCKEAEGMPFREWDTSHDLSVIRADGSRYKIAHFRHADDAMFDQWCRNNVPALLAEIARLTAQPSPEVVEIDLRAVLMEEIEKAAQQSPWVPPEYTMNEVVSDCCSFLREDRHDPAKVQAVVDALRDALLWTADYEDRAGWRRKARAALARLKGGAA